MAIRSAIENLRTKLEDPEGTEVNITVVVDAEAEAVEEALQQEEIDAEISEGEDLAESDEAGQEEAAELNAMASALREHGLTPGMQALLAASGKCAMYGIPMPAKEGLDATGRNMTQAEALAGAFEASGDSFWESTKKFFAEMWDKIKRMLTFIKTHLGGLEGRVKRAHDSLSGKSFDEDKGKNAKKFNDIKDPAAVTAAVGKLLAGLKSTASLNREGIASSEGDLPAEADLKAATGYKYVEGNKNRIEEDDKDFLKGEELTPSAALLGEYQSARFQAIQGVLAMMSKADGAVADAENCKKTFVKLAEDASKTKNDGKVGDEAKNVIKKSRDITSSWLKIIGRSTKVMTRMCTMYITGCAKVRACAKV